MGKKPDLAQVDRLCREAGIQPGTRLAFRFTEYLHACKESGDGGSGPNGDFTADELRDLIQEFLDHQGGR